VSVYSTRFFQGVCTTAGIVAYTVPAAQTVVLRDVEVWNPDAAVQHVLVAIGAPGHLATALFLLGQPGATTQWEGRVVVNGGEEIFVSSGSPDTQAIICGYLLSP
jgi:hypothetical protein